MRCKELNAARQSLTKVLADPRSGPGQRQRLERAKRELDVVARSGKLDRDRVFRATELIAAVLLEQLQQME